MQIYLARHGETKWSLEGKHTGLTDIPLTERGEQDAAGLGARLGSGKFDRVYTSPLKRSLETCSLAGFGKVAALDPDLVEWDYGDFEGLKSSEIREELPHWELFKDGCPGGEAVEDVVTRADRVLARLRRESSNPLIFSHGHFLRVLAARWLGLDGAIGRCLFLGTAAVSIHGHEHGDKDEVLLLWNDTSHVGS